MTNELLDWFQRYKRDLPWRRERSPYRVWISEMMLLQTQVKTVIPYYQRWLVRFPDVWTLAATPLDEVLKQWEGLGYYRRARNVHHAAQMMVTEHAGRFPTSYRGWLRLPGVGPYAAAALASILNNEAVVAVDGNVKRVSARLFALSSVTENSAQELLRLHLPQDQPGSFNEALMELGATICRPRNPACEVCPISNHCLARQLGRQHQLPQAKIKAELPHHYKYAVLYQQDGSIWLRQRPADGLLGGLWGFVLLDSMLATYPQLARVQHAYTHFRITVRPTLVTEAFIHHHELEGQLVPRDRLEGMALSRLDRKVLAVFEQTGRNPR